MRPLDRFFKGIFSFFSAIFTKPTLKKLDGVFTQVEGILPYAFEIASFIAKATPTRADDEILALASSVAFSGAIDLHSKEDALRSIARFLLQKKLRDQVVDAADSVMNAAIEIAVAGVKVGKEELPA